MSAGPAERRVRALSLRYAAWVRAVVCCACLLLGTLVVPEPWAAVPLLVLAVWTVFYARRLVRGPARWLIGTDVALLCLACLTQRWTVSDQAAASGTSWLLAVLIIACVSTQWFTRGILPVAALLASYLAGALWAVGAAEEDRLVMLAWLIPQAVLSRVCFLLVLAAAKRADALAVTQESERITAAVNAARRADEREQQALLHDTVAATLLMVGVGTVASPTAWLSEQAGRDLDVLLQTASPPPEELAELLRQEISRSHLRVAHGQIPSPVRLTPHLAAAIAGSVRESLANVRRHAGVDEARLTVELDPLRISISDDGKGFAEAAPSAHKRGISGSIVARTESAGGRATVTSAPGRGTVVRLEFPDA